MKELVTGKHPARQAARLFASHSGFPAASRLSAGSSLRTGDHLPPVRAMLGVVGHDLSKSSPDATKAADGRRESLDTQQKSPRSAHLTAGGL